MKSTVTHLYPQYDNNMKLNFKNKSSTSLFCYALNQLDDNSILDPLIENPKIC